MGLKFSFANKFVSVLILLLTILIFYPFQQSSGIHDYITLGGSMLLGLLIYAWFLTFYVYTQKTSVEGIKELFSTNRHHELQIVQESGNPEYNFMRLKVADDQIRVTNSPDHLKNSQDNVKLGITRGTIFAPLIQFLVFQIRSQFYPTIQFFVYFTTGLLVFCLFLALILFNLSLKLKIDTETKEFLLITKSNNAIQISVYLSEQMVEKGDTGLFKVEIPKSNLADELVISSIDEEAKKHKEAFSRGARILQSLTFLLMKFPKSLAVNKKSPNVKVLKKPIMNANFEQTPSDLVLIFGFIDPNLVFEFRKQLINWATN